MPRPAPEPAGFTQALWTLQAHIQPPKPNYTPLETKSRWAKGRNPLGELVGN